MKAARLYGARDIRVVEEKEPEEPAPGSSLIRVGSVGICGSDLHWFTEGSIGETSISAPVVPGHEFAGLAVTGPHEGRLVAVDPAIPCEVCETCRRGWRNLCPFVRFAGHGDLDGGMQELLTWPDHLLVPLPDSMDADVGALLEPLGVAIHATDLAHLRTGDDVLVVGAGPIGLLAVATVRRAGAGRVYVAESLPHRREAALQFGADAAWAPEETAAGLAEATSGRGVDVGVELAGNDAAIEAAVDAVRPGARIVLAGIPSTTASAFPASVARRKGITFAMARRMNDTYPRAIALAATLPQLAGLVTARQTLADVATGFTAAATREGLKTVIAVDDSATELPHVDSFTHWLREA